jgi:RNA polymerase sigma-70 factor, ECF subfamily
VTLSIDAALVESARVETGALERLIEAVWPEAYRIALAVLRDRGLAEDAAQDACATVARSLGTLKNPGTFAAWLHRIAVNAAVTIARRRPPVRFLDRVADRGSSVDTAEAVDLGNALAALPVVQRAVIVLHYYAGLKSREIAAATGLSSSTIRFHIMLARRALRRALAVQEPASPHSDGVLTHAR